MQTPPTQPADPAPLLRGMGTVLALWGGALIAYALFHHAATWAAVVGLSLWATALVTTRHRRQVA